MGSILITGGAGFIGRYFAAALAAAGKNVTVFDDLSCSNSSFDCAQLQSPRIKCVSGSMFDEALVARMVGDHRIVVHFAAVVGVEETISRTFDTAQNLIGTLNVARALTPEHVAMFGSSADVYGAHSHHYGDRPMRETDLFIYENAAINRWVYPHVKALEENVIGNSAARSIIIRFFNTYGPDMDFPAPKRVVPHFIDNVLHSRPLLLSGSGEQVRTFCYVDDMVIGLCLALDFAEGQKAPFNECFNLGGGIPVSMRDLANQFADLAHKEGLTNQRLPVIENAFTYSQAFDDSWNRVPDIGRARELLDFEPAITLEEGLRSTLHHYAAWQAKHMAVQP